MCACVPLLHCLSANLSSHISCPSGKCDLLIGHIIPEYAHCTLNLFCCLLQNVMPNWSLLIHSKGVIHVQGSLCTRQSNSTAPTTMSNAQQLSMHSSPPTTVSNVIPQFFTACTAISCNTPSHSPSCRKNHQRQLEALKQSVEAETKAKNEQTRQRKLMEAQLDELQSTIDSNEKVRKSDHQP